MDDSLRDPDPGRDRLGYGLPETLAEAEALAASIEQAVHRRTGRGVHDLHVEVGPEGIVLEGRCYTYYCKQLAQTAVLAMADGDRLSNRIEVI